MAQDWEKCRTLFFCAIFMSDQRKVNYLKMQIFHWALFSHLKMISVTQYLPIFGWMSHSFWVFSPPPLKKRLTFLWVSRRQIQKWMTDEFQIWMIQNPKFGINLKALDRAGGPVQRFWALHALLNNPFNPPPPPHQYSPIGSLRGKEASNANFLFSLHSNRLSFKIRISN